MKKIIRVATTILSWLLGIISVGMLVAVIVAVNIYKYNDGRLLGYEMPQIVTSFYQFLKTLPGYFVCICTPFLLLFCVFGFHSIKRIRKHRARQVAEMKVRRAIEQRRLKQERSQWEKEWSKAQDDIETERVQFETQREQEKKRLETEKVQLEELRKELEKDKKELEQLIQMNETKQRNYQIHQKQLLEKLAVMQDTVQTMVSDIQTDTE